MPKKVRLGSLKLELERERQVILDNKIPSQPVEQGKSVSDSIEKEPDIVEETVAITPKPKEDRAFTTVDLQGNETERFFSEEESIRFQLNDLIELREKEKVFRYVAPEHTIKEAAIQSIEYTRTSSVSYLVNLTIREIKRKGKEESEGEGETQDAGRKSNKEKPDEEVSEKIESIEDIKKQKQEMSNQMLNTYLENKE